MDILARLLGSVVLLAGCCTLMTSCAGVEEERRYQPQGRSDVSSIPWNSPEGWEQSSIPGVPGYFGTR